jgi:glycosyltransferase involved in cell wall biosynthesis
VTPAGDRPSIVYVVPDKMGGMMQIIANLLAYRRPDGFSYHAVLTHNSLHADTRFNGMLAADTQTTIEYTLPLENLHTVMRRLADAVPSGGGVLVTGDLLDLATASIHDFGRAVLYMLHGDTDYYYELAVRHDPVVHGFIAYSRRMYERLLQLLPHRRDTIFYLPYGVPIPDARRQPVRGPLRAVFAGRFENGQKGVFDLPAIDRMLRARGVHVAWTIAGAGPDEVEFRERWSFNGDVRWAGRLTAPALAALYCEQDVFVLPTRFEGLPVALLEGMAAGLVPVVSDIPSGVPDIVDAGVNGECPRVGDIGAFAEAIARLDADRERLEATSAAARDAVVRRFDILNRAAEYQALYARWSDLYRPLAAPEHLQYGSRLDHPWIPNTLVRTVRSAIRSTRS